MKSREKNSIIRGGEIGRVSYICYWVGVVANRSTRDQSVLDIVVLFCLKCWVFYFVGGIDVCSRKRDSIVVIDGVTLASQLFTFMNLHRLPIILLLVLRKIVKMLAHAP